MKERKSTGHDGNLGVKGIDFNRESTNVMAAACRTSGS